MELRTADLDDPRVVRPGIKHDLLEPIGIELSLCPGRLCMPFFTIPFDGRMIFESHEATS
jgi:hypothetical protein